MQCRMHKKQLSMLTKLATRNKGGITMKKYQALEIEILEIETDIITSSSGNTQDAFESKNGWDDIIGDFG